MTLPPSKILLVEDDAQMPEMLSAMLEPDGITVFCRTLPSPVFAYIDSIPFIRMDFTCS